MARQPSGRGSAPTRKRRSKIGTGRPAALAQADSPRQPAPIAARRQNSRLRRRSGQTRGRGVNSPGGKPPRHPAHKGCDERRASFQPRRSWQRSQGRGRLVPPPNPNHGPAGSANRSARSTRRKLQASAAANPTTSTTGQHRPHFVKMTDSGPWPWTAPSASPTTEHLHCSRASASDRSGRR